MGCSHRDRDRRSSVDVVTPVSGFDHGLSCAYGQPADLDSPQVWQVDIALAVDHVFSGYHLGVVGRNPADLELDRITWTQNKLFTRGRERSQQKPGAQKSRESNTRHLHVIGLRPLRTRPSSSLALWWTATQGEISFAGRITQAWFNTTPKIFVPRF